MRHPLSPRNMWDVSEVTLIHDHKPPTACSSVLSIHVHVFTAPHSRKGPFFPLFPFC